MDATASRAADRAAVRLLPDAAEIRLGERALGVSRVLLTIAALLAVYIVPSERAAVQGILLLYVGFAGILLVGLVASSVLPPKLPVLVHSIDIAFAATLARLPFGGSAPVFSFLLFPLFTAGARWGFKEVMLTTLALEAAVAADALFVPRPALELFLPPVAAIASAGAAIGYLAEQQRRRRFEDRALTVILSRARLAGTLSDSVNLVLASVRSALRARQVLVVFQEEPNGRVLMWRADLNDGDDGYSARPVQLPVSRHNDYWFAAPGVAWHARRRGRSPRRPFRAVVLDAQGNPLSRGPVVVPDGFLASHSCRRLICTTMRLGAAWTCRLFVLDPAMGVHREQAARFTLQLAHTVGPALYNNYLVRSLRTRAQSLERGRIAREMHDGVTQSLLGLEMEIAVLRRRAKNEAPPLSEDLARVHGIVRDEVVTIRELMEGIRVDDIASGDFMQHLSGVVDRFSRYTGISARLVSDGTPASLTPNVQRQVARILHEALVNVRKHSGADRVVIRTQIEGPVWKVTIEDDGRGFPFGGRLTHDELEAKRLAPRMIGERARIIGATIAIDSRPGFGSRVELSVPVNSP